MTEETDNPSKEETFPSLSYTQLWHRLTPLYDEGEARAMVHMVMEERFGVALTDLLCSGTEALSAADRRSLDELLARIEQAEPVQYVLGWAWFMGRRLSVEHGVLIPRPETEALCEWVMASPLPPHPHVLDVGCCIAVSLALGLPGAEVTALDLSPKAIEVTRRNAETFGAEVHIVQRDALTLEDDGSRWNVIVSNPPYICQREASSMHANVMLHEPHEALFVPDDDPLRFYTAIARYAATALRPGGLLFFECNALYTEATAAMLREQGFVDVVTHDDPFGRCRLVRGERNGSAVAQNKANKKNNMAKEMTEEAARLRLEALCSQAEHCCWEMTEKMRRWGLDEEVQARLLLHLTSERYIDEERYCRAFVHDKVHHNRWGRLKVEQGLMAKRIPRAVYHPVLDAVDPSDYVDALRPLLQARLRTLRGMSDYERNGRLVRFAMSRGFTMDIIRQCLDLDDD